MLYDQQLFALKIVTLQTEGWVEGCRAEIQNPAPHVASDPSFSSLLVSSNLCHLSV